MKDKTRQLLILFALLVFLSMITIFHVRMADPYPEPEDKNHRQGNFSGIDIERHEGEGLLTQSINGLIDLYRDLGTGLEVIGGSEDSD